jgi:parallel beta-helix repeat protein
LYPVQCRDVLIEDSVVRGASDAGVYLGQSRNIVVRRNHVEENVAGIEIENSNDADVYENVATENTGGILVFNLPGPPVQDGRRTRVYNNEIRANNTPNFGTPGSSVSNVPAGTGVMVLSNDQVEIFGNQFVDNDSTHILLVTYNTAEFFGLAPPNNPDFDPYSEALYVHDNTFEGGLMMPDLPELVVQIAGGVPMPAIMWDGDDDPAKRVGGELPAPLRVCIQEPGDTFVDLDVANGFAAVKHDQAGVNCSLDALPPIRLLEESRSIQIDAGPDAQDRLLEALLEAESGDKILLGAGTYTITQPLSLTVDHVTLQGAGMDDTILDFSGITSGGEGLLVQANDFTLRGVGMENAPGDQFKAIGCDGLRLQAVRAEWTNGPLTSNGAYGLYPVQCKDVLVEDSVVKGASDAGIYLGQSRNLIVRRNRVEFNVAGIEIENCTKADVHDNTVTNNTGGILVFNLPGLPVFGERTRVYANEIFENNTDNFAPAGNLVATVPTGTGMLVLANDGVEVFDNRLRDNNSSQLAVISYNTAEFLGAPPAADAAFDPFSESIYFAGNTYIGGGTMPDPDLDLLITLIGGPPVPNIVIDGDVDADKLEEGMLPADLRTCIQESGASFVNLNLADFPNTPPSRDLAPYNCTLQRLVPVAIAGVR